MIYQFKVTLQNVGVPVWRVVQIDGNATFYDLHQLIQANFEWFDYHLHYFDVRRTDGESVEGIEITTDTTIDEFEVYYVSEKYDEKEEILADWFLKANDRMMYTYDVGDDWRHEIVLQKILIKEEGAIYPRCIDAKNIGPDEDSRGEVIAGEVDLEFEDTEELIADINEEVEFMELTTQEYLDEEIIDYWPQTLAKAKEFHQLKPWELMTDEHIFAIEDPESDEFLFCSILGQADEMHGIAVYIGMDGFFTLMDSIANVKTSSEIVKFQRSLLLSFEDRTDLEKEEYDLIKTYAVQFRGRKAWPSFISFEPGLYPWMMDDEEARLMYLALKETIHIHTEMEKGLELPHIVEDEKLIVKYSEHDNMENDFENTTMELNELIADISFDEFMEYNIPTELEIKRATK